MAWRPHTLSIGDGVGRGWTGLDGVGRGWPTKSVTGMDGDGNQIGDGVGPSGGNNCWVSSIVMMIITITTITIMIMIMIMIMMIT